MERYGRLSRKERRRGLLAKLGWVAIGAIALILIVFFWSHMAKKNKKTVVAASPQAVTVNLQALSDSLILETVHSFALTDSLAVDSMAHQAIGNAGGMYRWYRQSWPDDLPFLVFVQRLNELAGQNHISCDCVETDRDGRLDCLLCSAGASGAHITLHADKETKLANREIAIVLTNSGMYEEADIKEMIYNGMVLNYLATPDIYPTASIQKLMQRGGVSAIIKMPATAQGWIDLGGRKHSNKFRFEEAQAQDALSHHPGTRALFFDMADGVDMPVVQSILSMAKLKKIAYFSPNYAPNAVDSLAAAIGVPLIRMDVEPDLKGLSLAEQRISLINRLLGAPGHDPKIVFIDAGATKPGELISMKLFFDKIGIKLRPFMKLAEPVKATVEKSSRRVNK